MTPPLPIDRALRVVTIALVGALGALGLARPDSILGGGAAWLCFLACALAGGGYAALRAARLPDVDFGLRAALGVAAYLALAGLLLAIGACNRTAILALAAVGYAGFAWRELASPAPAWRAAAAGLRFVRARPALALVVGVLGAAALVRILGAVAQLDRNPWDDDIAYTPLVKRLLDTGNLVEPFSFRRLGAYGGQTALGALAAARGGALASVHLADKGLCFGLALLALVGHARELGRVAGLWLALVVLVVLALPDIAINTASQWSGALLFVALYRCAARADSTRGLALAALVGAAACTLRQNYIPVAVAFLALTLLARRADRRAWLAVLAVGAAALVPWAAAAFASSRTFLFPFMEGTWNHGLSLRPGGETWLGQLGLFVQCAIDSTPLVIVAPLFVLLAFARDARPGKPLAALFAAVVLGFVLLVHAFSAADAFSIWRYAFGFGVPLALLLALEVANDGAAVTVPPLARWVLLAALLLQALVDRGKLPKQYAALVDNVREAAHGDPSARAERSRYAAMQAAVPAGARLLVMVDDAAYLDFARNRIANLDTPGFSSPGAQLPAFAGPDAWRAYLVGEGYRYVAFTRSERSRYYFRREFWLWRLVSDAELFQIQSAYTIDAIDTLAALAARHSIYDRDGLVVADLGDAAAAPPPRDAASEAVRRGAWVRQLVDAANLHDAWSLGAREGVAWEDGLGSLAWADDRPEPRWFEVARPAPPPTAGTPVRWMHRRVHARLRSTAAHGESVMHLSLHGQLNLHATYSRPQLDVSLDGELLASVVPDEEGAFAVQVDVPVERVADWADLYLVWSSVGQPERDVKDLRAARLENFEWEPGGR